MIASGVAVVCDCRSVPSKQPSSSSSSPVQQGSSAANQPWQLIWSSSAANTDRPTWNSQDSIELGECDRRSIVFLQGLTFWQLAMGTAVQPYSHCTLQLLCAWLGCCFPLPAQSKPAVFGFSAVCSLACPPRRTCPLRIPLLRACLAELTKSCHAWQQ